MNKIKKLKDEGLVRQITQKKVRKRCDICNDLAQYKHTFLLEGTRNNPASSAYNKDDCSWCEDHFIFTCETCQPNTPEGYVFCSRFECSDRFSHMFLEWQERSEG